MEISYNILNLLSKNGYLKDSAYTDGKGKTISVGDTINQYVILPNGRLKTLPLEVIEFDKINPDSGIEYSILLKLSGYNKYGCDASDLQWQWKSKFDLISVDSENDDLYLYCGDNNKNRTDHVNIVANNEHPLRNSAFLSHVFTPYKTATIGFTNNNGSTRTTVLKFGKNREYEFYLHDNKLVFDSPFNKKNLFTLSEGYKYNIILDSNDELTDNGFVGIEVTLKHGNSIQNKDQVYILFNGTNDSSVIIGKGLNLYLKEDVTSNE